ncbi:conserved hypothetical lipoprotein [Mycoplasmoides gallisepticum CA06_2006.052-5-2P]|uniref:Conserved hypothetical lipoprotein n=1 Tax=Mycoplasmoides gallisepticum WI01_2001.043-13-2P TaxID=1159201 RepID=J3VHK7_MYCGL|nr:hypothetical protein [Mycoplasmoides gallisepticum]AFP76245.1 conserved hypothetical lipoprotein [Mycoplasmoides gallisepticum VA94_7994-1-7P]AFP77013.1 conserved hypothetical lipoprotein [Mycoplasmoides gallisepticum NC95_13295-2-2P]AFP78537.1 conserved hypothetical lipoprotein [Mycoplasmoides gallisepticum NY01_2001.047-5-1P]AFP79298.1 conserved hypothetical lipoprotein [Mycoplasmoides gallisepticum WI01_2001.043-13-2P]AFP80036.1 conserved hypothetical lipoprotein [Mycoplasmoides gallisep
MKKSKLFKKQLAIGLFILPSFILSSCNNVIRPPIVRQSSELEKTAPSFAGSSEEYKGEKVNKESYYSLLSSNDLVENYQSYTDPKTKSLYDNVFAKNFYEPSALKEGFVGFDQNVYAKKEQAQDSLYREDNVLFYDGSLFSSQADLTAYIETKKDLLSEEAGKIVVLRNSDNTNSEPINVDQLRKNSQTERLKLFNYITKNSKLQVEINKGDTTTTINVDPSLNLSDTVQQIKSNVPAKDIPVHYQRISANNNASQYFVDTSEDDNYNFYGPLLFQGNADINTITNPDNWTKTSTLPIGLYRSISSDIVTSGFDFLLGEISIGDEKEIKILNRNLETKDFIFYFPYSEQELRTAQYSNNLKLNLAWADFIYQLKIQQPEVYKGLLDTVAKFNKAKRFSSFYKIPILYSYLLDSLIANKAKEQLIFLLKDFFIKLSNKIDSTLQLINSYAKPSGFDILANRDLNGNSFSFKVYFGIGNNDFDVSASLENLLPNLYDQFSNLTIFMTMLMLSNIVAATPGAILNEQGLIDTIKGINLFGNKQIQEIETKIKNSWPTLSAIWWLLSAQNLTQALFVAGFSPSSLMQNNLDENTLRIINGFQDAFSLKWIRNQFLQTSAIETIKNEIPLVLRDVPTERPKVRELFADIPKNVLEYLQGINVDFGTVIHIRNLYRKIKEVQKTDLKKAAEYLSQVSTFVKSLSSDHYVDLYLTYMQQFPSVINNKPEARSASLSLRSSIRLVEDNSEQPSTSNSNENANKIVINNSETFSTSKKAGSPAILQNPKEVNVNELSALEKLQKDQKKLQTVFVISSVLEGFGTILSSAVTVNTLINSPSVLNRTKDLVIAGLQTAASTISVSLSLAGEFTSFIKKSTAIVGALFPVFYGLTVAMHIAVLLVNVFFPTEEEYYYVFQIGQVQYVWTGGYKKTQLLGLKTLKERTIKDIKLIKPIQITRPQNASFLYYNQKQYSPTDIDKIKDLQITEWLENKNLYAMDKAYINNVNKIYSLHKPTRGSSVAGVYASSNLIDLYQNLLATLLSNSLITIPHTVSTSLNGSYISNKNNLSAVVVRDELNKAQNWTLVQVPSNEAGGYLYEPSKNIKITEIVSYDPETKIGVAKGMGKFGLNSTEFIFYNNNDASASHNTLKAKFNELLKTRKTVYLDSVGSRTKLIYRSELFSVFDQKLKKTIFFLSLRDAHNYIDQWM